MNLLTDPLLRVRTEQDLEYLNLPALLARLGKNEVSHLVGIQRHQHDPFHVFLCYLAGAVLARDGSSNPVQSEDFWREGLLRLAGNAGYEAWQLVSDDDSRPAFMQPPLPGDKRKPTSRMNTPDELDLLLTAKNHDVKQKRADFAQADTWLYSLISLQTMSGYYGSGNHGISRMNGGYGNRPIVELINDRMPGWRWIHAVARLLEHRKHVLKEPFGYDPEGLVLVWLEPWDGDTSLELAKLDPFYIEICRLIRLRGEGGVEYAESYTSRKPRIAAKELNGVVGDPWLPVELKGIDGGKKAGVKALTFPPSGITAEHMRRLIFEDELQLSVLQKPQPNWKGDLWLSASVLVRGQGITDGFYEWEVQIPEQKTLSVFGRSAQRDELERLSRDAIGYVATMQNRVLKPAVFAYVLGAPQKLDLDDAFGNSAWMRASRRFESGWSQEYFPWLFSVPEPFDDQEELRHWVEILRKHALTVLEEVEDGMANHSGRQYRILTEVRNRFWGAFYRNFAFMRGDHGEGSTGS
ncbi:MAG: type I-E CRISPR-associated protein Cse1/CasA [Firmicutes bacterium]|nr:type I-E CRISPR-associated protein Cse1/CasA [Bacillota bacterium]